MSSITTKGLTKDFGDLRAVDAIDMALPRGGATGFVGPNGAGKSTTIRMLLGLIKPTSGEGEVFAIRSKLRLPTTAALLALGYGVVSLVISSTVLREGT